MSYENSVTKTPRFHFLADDSSGASNANKKPYRQYFVVCCATRLRNILGTHVPFAPVVIFCRKNPPGEAHCLRSAARLVENLPDRCLTDGLAEWIIEALSQASFFIPFAPVKTYGMTPVHFAPTPGSRWRQLFTEGQIEGHLTDLLDRQQEDGGWPFEWEASGSASHSEWRGR